MQQPMETERVAVTACTPYAWVRGVVELGRMRRVSELLNSSAVGYLPLLDGEVLPLAAREWPQPHPHLYLSKAEILFIYPSAPRGDPRPMPGLAVQKFPLLVGLYVADFHLRGRLHLADRVPWEQYLTVLRDRFLALTGATITRAATGEEVAKVDFVAVSRERVGALYPME